MSRKALAMKLLQAPKSCPLRVVNMKMDGTHDLILRRLMELGFIDGSIIEIRHEGPLFKDPVAVLVRGMVVALRRYEAELISVEPFTKEA